MIHYTDNPVQDAANHSYDGEKWLEARPFCSLCGEHIQDEFAVFLFGEWFCDSCIEDAKRFVEE